MTSICRSSGWQADVNLDCPKANLVGRYIFGTVDYKREIDRSIVSAAFNLRKTLR